MTIENGTHRAAAQSLIADVPTPAMPAWAPDGSAVAFLWDDGTGWEVWVAGSAGHGARQLATGALLSAIDWTGDGAEIVFVRRVDGGSVIAAVNLAGDVRQITSGPRDRSPQVSPDGSTIAFLSGRSGAFDVWKAPLAGGAATQLTERTNPLDEPRWTPRWSPDGGWLSYVSSRSGERNNDDLWIVSSDGRENRQLTTGLIVDTDPIWSPDGSRLAVVGNTAVEHWYGDDLDLWLVDLVDVRPRRLTSGGGVTRKLDGGAVAWSLDGRCVYCLNHLNGDTNLAAVRVEDGLLTRVTNHDGVVSDFTLSPIGDAFAIVIAGQTAPPELAVLADRRRPAGSADERRQPGRLLPSLPRSGCLSRATTASTATLTSTFLRGSVPVATTRHSSRYTAAGRTPSATAGTRSNSSSPNVASSSSPSNTAVQAATDAISRASRMPTGAVARHAMRSRRQGSCTSKSYVSGVGIYGGSYGGYLALHAIVAAPEAFGAAADLYGITNRFDYFDRSDRVGRVFVTRDYGGRGPADAPEHYLRASTHHRLGEIRTPLLVLHGSEDTRVPPVQSEAVVEQLRQHGIEHEYVVYPGEGHGFRKREHRIDAYERLATWFERHLAPVPPHGTGTGVG